MATVVWFKYPPGSKWLSAGGSGGIYYFPDNLTEVIKVPSNQERSNRSIEIEKRIYERLGSHPNIVPVLRIDETGIVLKRAVHGSLRQYFGSGGTATINERIMWCRDVAAALHFVHEHGIKQIDIGGRNILLDSSRTVLLCDFAGSSIDGEPPTIMAECGFKHPTEHATIQAELHALGSTIYEIITSSRPWKGIEEGLCCKWIEEGKYPDVSEVKLGATIAKCWKGEFGSAEKVAQSIESEIRFVNFLITERYLTLAAPPKRA